MNKAATAELMQAINDARYHRGDLQWSQVAEELEINPANLSKLRNGHTDKPSVGTLFRVLRWLDLSDTELLRLMKRLILI